MKLGQIVYCNLKVKTMCKKKKEYIIENCIFSHPYEEKRNVLYWSEMNDRRLIKQTPFKEDLCILKIDIISYLGFRHKGSGYTEVKKTNENRNKITGAYD